MGDVLPHRMDRSPLSVDDSPRIPGDPPRCGKGFPSRGEFPAPSGGDSPRRGESPPQRREDPPRRPGASPRAPGPPRPGGGPLPDRDRKLPGGGGPFPCAGLPGAVAYTHPLPTLDQAKHVLGPAVYAARARELAADADTSIGDEEIRWAIEHASPEVREVVRRWPARGPGRSRLDALYFMLDAGLRA